MTAKKGWTQMKTKGAVPSPRYCAAIGIYKDTLYLFGGFDTNRLNTLHALDLKTGEWSLIPTSGAIPPPRSHHSMAVMGNKLLIFGGLSEGAKLLNDTYILDLDKMVWSQLRPRGTPPCGRLSHIGVALDHKTFFVFGGYDGKSRLNDVFLLHIDKALWAEPIYHGRVPSKRLGHSAATVGDKILIFGGDDDHKDRELLNDVHIFDYRKMRWLQPRLQGEPPSGRIHATATVIGNDKVYIFAGSGSRKRKYDDIHVLDVATLDEFQQVWIEQTSVSVQLDILQAFNELKDLLRVAQDVYGQRRSSTSSSEGLSPAPSLLSDQKDDETKNNASDIHISDDTQSPRTTNLGSSSSNLEKIEILPSNSSNAKSDKKKDKKRSEDSSLLSSTVSLSSLAASAAAATSKLKKSKGTDSHKRGRQRRRSPSPPSPGHSPPRSRSRSRSRSKSPPRKRNSSPSPTRSETPQRQRRQLDGASHDALTPVNTSAATSPATSPPLSPLVSPSASPLRKRSTEIIKKRGFQSGLEAAALAATQAISQAKENDEHLEIIENIRHTFSLISSKFEKLSSEKEAFIQWESQQKHKAQQDARHRTCQEERIQQIIDQQTTKLRLNVGGTFYETSLATLTKVKNSMLAVMFSGRYSMTKEPDGSYFIDRDGTNFKYILNYLRYGKDVYIEPLYSVYMDLIQEATFYQLDELVDLLQSHLDQGLVQDDTPAWW